MKFDDLLCCPSCGGMFRPIRAEELCSKCTLKENEALAAIAHEMEPDNEAD